MPREVAKEPNSLMGTHFSQNLPALTRESSPKFSGQEVARSGYTYVTSLTTYLRTYRLPATLMNPCDWMLAGSRFVVGSGLNGGLVVYGDEDGVILGVFITIWSARIISSAS